MKTKTRLIILFVLIVSFLVIAPWLVFYSLGYRVDFENGKVVGTGGIYIRIEPSPATVTIDEKITDEPGVFSNSVFIQNLLPGLHTVLVQKDGYYDYQKNLAVKEKEVTKLESVTLFSKNILFNLAEDLQQFSLLKEKPVGRFVILKNTLYYFDGSPENAKLTPAQRSAPLIKNILAFESEGSTITWFGLDGFLKKTNIDTKVTENITEVAKKPELNKVYQITTLSQHIFLKEGSNLFLLNPKTKSLDKFYNSVKDLVLSPDGQKVIYFNDKEIFIYYFQDNSIINGANNILLQTSSEKINEVYWLNNDYIVFNAESKIIISEIDHRGNVNTIILPNSFSLLNKEVIDIVKPEIFFESQSKTLYILTNNKLIFTNRLLP